MHLAVGVVVRPRHTAVPDPVAVATKRSAVFEAHEREAAVVRRVALHLHAQLRPPAPASTLGEGDGACQADQDRNRDEKPAALPIHCLPSAALICWLLSASAVNSFSSSAA